MTVVRLKDYGQLIVMTYPGRKENAPRMLRVYSLLTKAGYKVKIVEPKEFLCSLNVRTKIGRTIRYALMNIALFIDILRLMRKSGVRCVHCCTIWMTPLGIMFKKLFGCKFVYDAYEYYHLFFKRISPGVSGILDAIERIACTNADLVVVTWWRNADFLRRRYKSENVVVFLNVPLEELFISSCNLDRRDLCLTAKDFVVYYGGTIDSQYYVTELVQAVKKLVFNHGIKNVKLLIAGSGPLLPKLKQMIKDYGLEEHCVFVGRVPYRLIPCLIRLADVVYLSLIHI